VSAALAEHNDPTKADPAKMNKPLIVLILFILVRELRGRPCLLSPSGH